MRKLLSICIYCIFFVLKLEAQTFTVTGGSIPDGGPQVSFPITVSGLPQPVINSSFGLETVCVNITHSRVGDLAIKLKAPDGMIINLSLNNGSDGVDHINTCFNNASNNAVYSGSAPFTGTYRPDGALGNVNNGQNGNGVWELWVEDISVSDVGSLVNFSLTFSASPSLPSTFISSDLPIVVINTNGITLRDEPKRKVRMGIIYNGVGIENHITDPWNNYNSWAMVEYRGANSGTFPQKSFGFETCDIGGYELTSSLLSMPQESDWTLIATYSDASLMRNVLTYELGNQMGNYAPRTRFCEVVVDGQYQGVYALTEKIKRDPDRVNIAKLQPEDITGDDLTGGYIIKIDRPNGNVDGSWLSPFPPPNGIGPQVIAFQYHYPKTPDRQPQQEAYIQAYVDSFENALASPDFADVNVGYRHFADMNSFIDNFIINEVSRNIDAYVLSYFFYKDKNSNGGKLKSGPLWDYNAAWANAGWCNSNSVTGWAYNLASVCPTTTYLVPFWWTRMLQDTNYTNTLRCRWDDLRNTTLSNDDIFSLIDNTAIYLNEAQLRHYDQWSIAQSYDDEINDLKDWIALRMAWLDAHMPGSCSTSVAQEHIKTVNSISVYPNPFAENIELDLTTQYGDDITVRIYSPVGQLIYSKTFTATAGKNHYSLHIGESLAPGVYLLKASANGHSYSQRLIKQVK